MSFCDFSKNARNLRKTRLEEFVSAWHVLHLHAHFVTRRLCTSSVMAREEMEGGQKDVGLEVRIQLVAGWSASSPCVTNRPEPSVDDVREPSPSNRRRTLTGKADTPSLHANAGAAPSNSSSDRRRKEGQAPSRSRMARGNDGVCGDRRRPDAGLEVSVQLFTAKLGSSPCFVPMQFGRSTCKVDDDNSTSGTGSAPSMRQRFDLDEASGLDPRREEVRRP